MSDRWTDIRDRVIPKLKEYTEGQFDEMQEATDLLIDLVGYSDYILDEDVMEGIYDELEARLAECERTSVEVTTKRIVSEHEVIVETYYDGELAHTEKKIVPETTTVTKELVHECYV